MIIRLAICASILLAIAACDDKSSSRRPPATTCQDWTPQYSAPSMQCFSTSFVFPSDKSGVHYLVRKAPPVSEGMTYSLAFSIDGIGTFAVSDASDQPPAHIRLYLQRRGDQLTAREEHKRFWSAPLVLAPGDHAMAVKLDPALWTSVFGKRGSDTPGEFQATLSSLEHFGFTFGGMFAGHGVYVTGGTMTMTIKGFSIQ